MSIDTSSQPNSSISSTTIGPFVVAHFSSLVNSTPSDNLQGLNEVREIALRVERVASGDADEVLVGEYTKSA